MEQVDDFHGTAVADPYRWLEADVREDESVAAWVEAQNEVTFAYLGGIPERERIEERLTAGFDLGTEGKIGWSRDELHER